jgi:hypothetical protein
MQASQLGFINEKAKTLSLFSSDKMMESVTIDKSIAAGATVAGWTAWECRPKTTCSIDRLRIGISDAAGVVSWQILAAIRRASAREKRFVTNPSARECHWCHGR